MGTLNINEVKEIIKEYMDTHYYHSAPTMYEMIEILDEYEISNEQFWEAIEEIGEELEQQGYELIWQNCKEHDAGCQRFLVAKYPNERELTDEETERIREYLIEQMGYWKTFDYTNGFDFATDGQYVWVRGEREGYEPKIWSWDEIDNPIF